jgi:hypothetical protein
MRAKRSHRCIDVSIERSSPAGERFPATNYIAARILLLVGLLVPHTTDNEQR